MSRRGAKPDAIIGHSVGEIAAAVVAEALTPDKDAIIVCRRVALYHQAMGQGAMCLVDLPICQTPPRRQCGSDSVDELEGRRRDGR